MSFSTLKPHRSLSTSSARLGKTWLVLALVCSLIALQLGCQTAPPPAVSKDTIPYSEVRLREGDLVKIAFPGAPNLDVTQQVRRDGKITMTLGGEIVAIGKTPAELEKEVLKTYESQLAVKQVVVTVGSSSYPIYVTGSVMRPGKLLADRPMSVMDAIMESGGFDFARANLKEVTVLRQFEAKTITYKMNMKDVLDGKDNQPFFLKPSDVIYVPQKFNWF